MPDLCAGANFSETSMDGWVTNYNKKGSRQDEESHMFGKAKGEWVINDKNTTDLQMLVLIWIYKTSLALSTSLLLTRCDSLLQLYCTIHSESPCFLPAAKPISFLLSKPKKIKIKKNRAGYDMIWLESRWRRLHVTISSHSQLKFSSFP